MFEIHTPEDRWYYADHASRCITEKLTTGTIVIAGREPFRIDRVTELPTDQWPDKFVEVWRSEGMPDASECRSRPYRVSGLYEGPKASDRIHSTIAAASHRWSVLPEHCSVCRLCHELPPCRHVHNERIAERATERLAEDMAIMPGVCHGCREPITKRQKSFTFPGPNLVRPDLGDNTAIFHTRGACYSSLTSYDKRWATAEPDRTRLFFCEGTRIWHHDGSSECDRPDCHAKGAMEQLVDHRCQIWHHPGDLDRAYNAMRDFGHDPSGGHKGCWCLAGVRKDP